MNELTPNTLIELLLKDSNSLLDRLRGISTIKDNPHARARHSNRQLINTEYVIPLTEIKKILGETLAFYKNLLRVELRI